PVPYELEKLVGHCLAKDPRERYQSARDLAFTLQAIALGGSTGSLSTPAPPGRLRQAGAPSTVQTAVVVEAEIPETRYAKSGDVNIAYQVVGSGPIDLVFVMGWITHIDYFWREPSFARFLRRLASFSRLILFDKRGTGLSDRVPLEQLPTLEQRMDDVRA